jgi:hypothetical protein
VPETTYILAVLAITFSITFALRAEAPPEAWRHRL